MKPIEKAIQIVGSQVALAKAISNLTGQPVSQQRIWRWLNGSGVVPAEFCISVEKITGEVTRYDLRPQDAHLIWPPEERRCAECPHDSPSSRDPHDG